MKKKTNFGLKIICLNRKASFNYFFNDLIEYMTSEPVVIQVLEGVNAVNNYRKIMGSTSFGNYSERDKRIEIGWTWLRKDFQGNGYNVQAKENKSMKN